jgi:hypothetical protein
VRLLSSLDQVPRSDSARERQSFSLDAAPPKVSVARSQWRVTRRSPAVRSSCIREAPDTAECQRGDAPDTGSRPIEPSKLPRSPAGTRSPRNGESTRMRLRPGCASW